MNSGGKYYASYRTVFLSVIVGLNIQNILSVIHGSNIEYSIWYFSGQGVYIKIYNVGLFYHIISC